MVIRVIVWFVTGEGSIEALVLHDVRKHFSLSMELQIIHQQPKTKNYGVA
jgi:hypothetical protein